MNYDNERLAYIEGYDNKYMISDHGRVWSYKSNNYITPYVNQRGYYDIVLRHNKVNKHHKIHRLVAIYFVDNPMNLEHVNHKDGNSLNNIYTNLEWCTVTYNNKYRFIFNPDMNTAENNPSALLTNQQALEIYKLAHSGHRPVDIAKIYNIPSYIVSNIKNGKRYNTVTKHNKIKVMRVINLKHDE